jgi:hypothetical protein
VEVARLISPVDALTKFNPAGDELNRPPDTPVIVGVGFVPEEQNVEDE